MKPDASLAADDYCYLTTVGRVTGKPHTIEIWFALEGGVLYIMAGAREKSDWVRNLITQPAVSIRIRDVVYEATARIVREGDKDALARRLLVRKYARQGHELEEWGRTALPVAFEFVA